MLAWLGYDPPDGLGWAAAREQSARAGAAALVRLVRVLVAHRPAVRITLIGHSYGALVVGLAAPHLPRQVTDLVALGGVGMGRDRAGEVSRHARIWAAEAPDDWIQRVPSLRLLGLGHGARPAEPDSGRAPCRWPGLALLVRRRGGRPWRAVRPVPATRSAVPMTRSARGAGSAGRVYDDRRP